MKRKRGGQLQNLMGLKELIARSKPDECPFCGEPRGRGPSGRLRRDCGDEICVAAYHVYWKRDATGNARKFSEEQYLSDLRAKQQPSTEEGICHA